MRVVGKKVRRVVFRPRAAVRRGGKRTRPSSRQLLATLLAGLVAAGCSSSAPQRAEPDSTTTTIATSTTLDQARQAVLDAYRRYWQVYIAVGNEMKLPDPRVAEVASGDALRQVNSAFLAARADGEVFRGTIDLAPVVTALTADSATVSDCYASHILGYDARSGQAKGLERPGRTLVTATMVREAERWKVSGIRHEGDGCTPAS